MKIKILELDSTNTVSGNVYPKEVIQKAIDEYMEIPAYKRFGCFGIQETPAVELINASHKVKSVEIEKDSVVAEIELLTTPMGEKLKEMLDNKISLEFKPRGIGSVNRHAGDKILDDYQLISIDCVINNE